MANRYAVQNGNWSSTSTWDGGTLPQPGDTVRTNTYIVTIDQDIDVALLNNEGFGSAALGGYFITSGNVTIKAEIRPGGSNVPLVLLQQASSAITIIGDTYAGSGNSSRGITINAVNIVLNYIGNIYGGSAGNSGTNTSDGLRVISSGFIMNLTGNLYGGTHFTSPAIRAITTMNLNMVGIMYGNNGQSFVQGTLNQSLSIAVTTAGSYVSGNITCVSSALTGNATNVALVGNDPTTSTRIVIDKEIRTNGFAATVGGVSFKNNNPVIETINASGSLLTFVDSSTSDYPIQANVRQGISYNSGTLVGTLKVPNSGSVALGVPFDNNSVGTALLTGDSWIAAISSSNDPFAERLRNTATVQTTAAQIAAF
jgi:hypothetical protein